MIPSRGMKAPSVTPRWVDRVLRHNPISQVREEQAPPLRPRPNLHRRAGACSRRREGSLREGTPRSGEGARVGWMRGCRNRAFCKGITPYWYKTPLYLRRLPPSLRYAPCHLCPSALMVAARRSQALFFRSLAALHAISKQLSIVLKRLTPGGRHSYRRLDGRRGSTP